MISELVLGKQHQYSHLSISLGSPWEGNGNPLQYSCLENPMDGGAWWAAVYGIAQSRTRLKWLSSSRVSMSTPMNWSTGHWDPGSLLPLVESKETAGSTAGSLRRWNLEDRSKSWWACCFYRDEWQACALGENEQAGEATGRREKWREFGCEVRVAQPCRPSQCFSLLHESLECLKKHGYLYLTNWVSCGAWAPQPWYRRHEWASTSPINQYATSQLLLSRIEYDFAAAIESVI